VTSINSLFPEDGRPTLLIDPIAIEQIQCPYMKAVGLREALGGVGYYAEH